MNLAVLIALSSFIIAVFIALAALLVRHLEVVRARRKGQPYDLTRHTANPIVSPRANHEWETEGTFNPGAVTDDHGIVHLFYRALGRDGISRIGHAESSDGRMITDRSDYPVYEPVHGYGMPDSAQVPGPHHYDLAVNPSGGGWGGAEDPRAIRIGDRVYIIYTAFEGWDNMRIGVTSISMKDLEAKKWRWKRPALISPAKAQNKNWVFFPEKIRGKYVILHSVSPTVSVEYVDSPESMPAIKSHAPKGGRQEYWDNWMRGAGAPPIKTDIGWLLLYHAMDKLDPNKYKVGAMILDLEEPTKVLYRSPEPILSPEMPYENDGKPGVVYATGAVVKDGKLFVYYGGGDRHTCVAETPMAPLLEWLKRYGKV